MKWDKTCRQFFVHIGKYHDKKPRFWLGRDKTAAELRASLIKQLYERSTILAKEIGEVANIRWRKPAWTVDMLDMAKSIARGQPLRFEFAEAVVVEKLFGDLIQVNRADNNSAPVQQAIQEHQESAANLRSAILVEVPLAQSLGDWEKSLTKQGLQEPSQIHANADHVSPTDGLPAVARPV